MTAKRIDWVGARSFNDIHWCFRSYITKKKKSWNGCSKKEIHSMHQSLAQTSRDARWLLYMGTILNTVYT
jgi:hypothetical protein